MNDISWLDQLKTKLLNIIMPKIDIIKGITAFLFILIFIYIGLYRLQPLEAIPVNASNTLFSAERAIQHVEAAAQAPRTGGFIERERVREYILDEFIALGFEPTVQQTSIVDHYWGNGHSVQANDTHNIVVRLKGTNTSKAVLIAGRYDSVRTSPDASRGGASVAVILELARALQAATPLQNDVIFVLTSEWHHNLAARAFVKDHPWAEDVGVVLHFIASGTDGSSIMFETSPQNGWLVEAFADASPRPIGNSLTYNIYQLLPHVFTDFTGYKNGGFPGLNFAFIENPAYASTMLDNPENLSLDSLQHQGSQALSLTQHLGDLDLTDVKEQDAIYFDIWGLTVVRYPQSWNLPLMILVTLFYAGVIAFGIKKGELTFVGIGKGLLYFLSTIIASLVAVLLLGQLILWLHCEYRILSEGGPLAIG